MKIVRRGPPDPLDYYDVAIYALCEPHGLPRYVGSSQHPDVRLAEHLKEIGWSGARGKWLRRLLDSGQQPLMRILEWVPRAKAREREARWMAWYLAEGYPLLNHYRPDGRKREEELLPIAYPMPRQSLQGPDPQE